MESKDYRPVSILPVLSKVHEKLVIQQRAVFIESESVYHRYQSSYKKNHSTATLLLKIHDGIKKAMKSNEVTITMFTDYSKAFDTFYFSILIKKMHALSFSKRFLYWIFNNLTDRKHLVQIDSNILDILKTSFGLPQRSILGPILFNLCEADMRNILLESQCIQYNDDSTIYRSCNAKEPKNVPVN